MFRYIFGQAKHSPRNARVQHSTILEQQDVSLFFSLSVVLLWTMLKACSNMKTWFYYISETTWSITNQWLSFIQVTLLLDPWIPELAQNKPRMPFTAKKVRQKSWHSCFAFKTETSSTLLCYAPSLVNKLDELPILINSWQDIADCSVLCFTKTWLNAGVSTIPHRGFTQEERLSCVFLCKQDAAHRQHRFNGPALWCWRRSLLNEAHCTCQDCLLLLY